MHEIYFEKKGANVREKDKMLMVHNMFSTIELGTTSMASIFVHG
jgi:hypothetical protein